MNKINRLANQALQLKKGWLVLMALSCQGNNLTGNDIFIPDYQKFGNKELKRHIQDLEDDFDSAAKRAFLNWKRTKLNSSVQWLAERYDSWLKLGLGIFELGRVYEVEKATGSLFHRKEIDCPPYAQVMLQGFQFSAIRHPEYHLARDLALLYNLFLDSESIADEFLEKGIIHSTEHNQSLGRSVILTCFNLLESFISGIGAEYLIENPSARPEIKSKLEDDRLSLRKRLILFPDLITRKNHLVDDSKSPFHELLGECKRRRDSFVHCESGDQPTKWGYVKEKNFHDVDAKVFRKTVKLTLEAICFIWKHIHSTEKPSWLPTFGKDGRFSKIEFSLRPVKSVAQEN
jgi:hypothetical protein